MEASKQSEPQIIAVGKPGSGAQYFLVLENSVLFKEEDFFQCIILLFAIYYNFNITYVRCLHPILLFFQDYVFKIGNKHKTPPVSLQNFLQATQTL